MLELISLIITFSTRTAANTKPNKLQQIDYYLIHNSVCDTTHICCRNQNQINLENVIVIKISARARKQARSKCELAITL